MEKGKSMDVFDSMDRGGRLNSWRRMPTPGKRYSRSVARCGYPITGSKLVYIPAHDEFYCLDCVGAMTEINEAAEVD